jgi:ribosomal protein S18 acetylase RimI-like enzyme
MNIRLSSIKAAEKIFKIFKDCKKSMELENIFQWTDSYPNLEIIIKDIDNKELYELYKEDDLIGVICFNTRQEPEYLTIDWLDKNENFLVVHRLAINPSFQNQGFAKELMIFAEDYALNKGFTSIRLDAYSGNEKALRLYERLNYKKRGKINFPERDLPFYCYERILK